MFSVGLVGCGEDASTLRRLDAGPPRSERDFPITGIGAEVTGFFEGDRVFDTVFQPADGLGPLFVNPSCGICHLNGGRGPGAVFKMSMVEADGVTPSADQSALPWGHSVRDGLAAGARTPIEPPQRLNVKVTPRFSIPLMGRGYLEAVADAEIRRVAAEQAARTDGIHGRTNILADGSIGRFGVKARIATLEEFSAAAFQEDMGLTSPLRPIELLNPDGLIDDDKPGVDIDQDALDQVTYYVRRVAIPPRAAVGATGRALFDEAFCSVCHVPTLSTRSDAAVSALADIDAPIYSDLLLHDMGPALADGIVESQAGSRDFRTAPLIGMGVIHNFLHDGSVVTVEEAIEAHAGEAAPSRQAFDHFSFADRQALVEFVTSL